MTICEIVYAICKWKFVTCEIEICTCELFHLKISKSIYIFVALVDDKENLPAKMIS